nr:MAG TPA: hypothetical protein [Caudoviricetes sp.]
MLETGLGSNAYFRRIKAGGYPGGLLCESKMK